MKIKEMEQGFAIMILDKYTKANGRTVRDMGLECL